LDNFLKSIGAVEVADDTLMKEASVATAEPQKDPFLESIGAVETEPEEKFGSKDTAPEQTVYLSDVDKTLGFPSDAREDEISYEVDKFYKAEEKKSIAETVISNTAPFVPFVGRYLPGIIDKVPKEAKEFGEITKTRWRKGYEQPVSGMNWGQLMMGEKTLEQTKSDDAKIKGEYAQYDVKDYDWKTDPLKFLWGKGVEMAPFMWGSTVEGAKGAMAGASAGALAGVMVGGLDPSDLGFVAMGAKVGAVYKTLDYTMRVEGGGVMEELINDDVPEGTARAVALPAGLISAAIELLQLDMLISSPIRRVLAKKVIQNPTVKKAIMTGISSYLKTYFSEVGQEGIQKATTETFKILGLYVDGKIPASEMNALGIAKRILKDIPTELSEAAQGMVFFPLGGSVSIAVDEATQAVKAKKTVGENRQEAINDRDTLEEALDKAEVVVNDIMEQDKVEETAKEEPLLKPEEKAEVSVPLAQEALKYDSADEFVESQTLVVANLGADGKIYYGKPGDLHFNLSEKHGEKIRKDMNLQEGEATWTEVGFAKPGGELLSREEALKLTQVKTSVKGELDAKDFQEQELPKTKSQLTDIWNKAHATKETSLEQEALKYDSAEEFVKGHGKCITEQHILEQEKSKLKGLIQIRQYH